MSNDQACGAGNPQPGTEAAAAAFLESERKTPHNYTPGYCDERCGEHLPRRGPADGHTYFPGLADNRCKACGAEDWRHDHLPPARGASWYQNRPLSWTHKQMLQTKVHLAAWVVARQRGITVADCDAIADAAVDQALETLTAWGMLDPEGNR